MKRATVLLMLPIVFTSTSVAADPGHERPRITRIRWEDPPVTAGDGDCQKDCHEEVLIVKAHDPDSSITEIEIWFGEGQPISYAHTGCVQGNAPGVPARVKVGVTYNKPGTFKVKAVAYSHLGCLPHENGDVHEQVHSRVKKLKTDVGEAEF